MRRFDTPTAPPGWDGQGAELLRIVDPTGRAIAWLTPSFGANCVGYAVRHDGPAPGGWRQVLRAGKPRELRADPLAYGCAILGPEMTEYGSAHLERWRFVERDPTAATCAVRCGVVRLGLTARLQDAALHLDLSATNEGAEPATISLGVRLCLDDERRATIDTAPDPFNSESGTVVVRLADAPGAESAARWQGVPGAQAGGAVELWGIDRPGRVVAPGECYGFALVIAPD